MQARKYEARDARWRHEVLPPKAQAILVEAAAKARTLPLESVPRKNVIEKAAGAVRRDFPELFR